MDNMAKKMLIDATHAEETRVVVVDGNKVEEFDFESENKRQIAGNIYLAKVTRVEPSLQAAFVDYGGNRHGFLAFSEIHPDYYQIPVADREALMEEERALAEADARAEEEDEAPKKRRRRGPRRRNNKPAEAVTETEVDGMETIDLDASDESDENDAPMAAPIVEDEPMIVTQEVDAPEDAAHFDHFLDFVTAWAGPTLWTQIHGIVIVRYGFDTIVLIVLCCIRLYGLFAVVCGLCLIVGVC